MNVITRFGSILIVNNVEYTIPIPLCSAVELSVSSRYRERNEFGMVSGTVFTIPLGGVLVSCLWKGRGDSRTHFFFCSKELSGGSS